MASIVGTTGADVLTGTPGDDVIDGLGGADTLTGGGGHDQFVFAPSYPGTATITDFQSGLDQLVIGGPVPGNFVIVYVGDNHDSTVYLGASSPSIVLTGVVVQAGDIVAPNAPLEIFGSSGADVLTTRGAIGLLGIADGGDGNDVLYGGDLGSALSGGSGDDVLYGGAGSDYLYAAEPGDAVGNDVLHGGAGDDYLTTEGGNDVLDGGDGQDWALFDFVQAGIHLDLTKQGVAQDTGVGLMTLVSIEVVSGSPFDDVITAAGATQGFQIDGGGGNDVLIGGAGADVLTGGNGQDTLTGGAGADLFVFYVPTGSSGSPLSVETITDFDHTQDAVVLRDAGYWQYLTTDVTVHLQAGGGWVLDFDVGNGFEQGRIVGLTGTIGGDRIIVQTSSVATLTVLGSSGNDILQGSNQSNFFENSTVSYANAAAGVSVSLSAYGPQDTVGAGVDTISGFYNLTGSAFNDTLEGDFGDNILDGGGGTNTVSYAHGNPLGVTVSLALQGEAQNTGGQGKDTLSNFQNLTGSPYNDTLEGDGGNNVLDGGGGINTLSYAHASAGVTVSLALQGSAQDTIGAGRDTILNFQNLTGSAFADVLTGDAHNNVISGGGGNDVLTGGLGADTFLFAPGTGTVTITDFSHAQGDQIVLWPLGAFHSLADILAATVQSGADAVISLPGGGSLTLDNVQKSALAAADFGLSPPPATASYAPDDLNGDHYSDILLHAADSRWGFYSINTGLVNAGGSDPNFAIVGTGDFDGNGLADVVFRNNATGAWGYAQSTHGQGSPWVYAGLSDPNYVMSGIADFNGDGIPDVVFRNNSTGEWGYAAMSHGAGDPWVYAGLSDPNYALAGVGDFNGDGVPDVLFRNNATGEMGYAAMSHGAGDPWVYIGLTDNSETVAGIGDFNGDGIPDVLMSNPATGDWGYVVMTHGLGTSWFDAGTLPSGYSIVGVGDYNGDGISDVLMRDNATGAWGYEAFGHGVMSWQPLPQSDPAFMVVG